MNQHKLTTVSKVVVECGVLQMTVYVENGVVIYTEKAEDAKFKGWYLPQLSRHLRKTTGCKVVIHNTSGRDITDLCPEITHIHHGGVSDYRR